MIQRLALYLALSTLILALGYTVSSSEFWCFAALFWCADQLGRRDGYEDAYDVLEQLITKTQEQTREALGLLSSAREEIKQLESRK